MDVLINSVEGTLSQCVGMSNYYIVHYKYLTILFVSYTSIKLEKNFKKEQRKSKMNT